MDVPKLIYSFSKGYELLNTPQKAEFKRKVCEYLGTKYSVEFTLKKHAWQNIPHHVYLVITGFFEEFGVKEADVWDIRRKEKKGAEE